MTQQTHTLEARDGTLYLKGEILLCIYDSGDCDTIEWPAFDVNNLEAALYDEYQQGSLSKGDNVCLPDGQLFGRCEGLHFIMNKTIR